MIGSTLGLLMVWLTGSSYGSIAVIVRIFRIGRILRIVRGMESMTQLFETLLVTLPSLGNVGALLFLLFFIYAIMGVQLFAKVNERSLRVDRRWRRSVLPHPVSVMVRYGTVSGTVFSPLVWF